MTAQTTSTLQEPSGNWKAVVDGTTCTHRHGSEQKALDCIDWEVRTLTKKGYSAWARQGQAAVPFPTLGTAATDGELASDEDMDSSHEYVPSADLLALEIALARGAQRRPAANLMFVGPPGSGKTAGARDFAARMGVPFTQVDAASMTDPESWFGTREIVAEEGVAVTRYSPSSFVESITQPGVTFIDEANRIRDDQRQVLNPLLDWTRQVMNPLTGEIVRRHPQNFVVLAGNVGIQYTGTSAIDPSLINRILIIEFDYLGAADEERIVRDATGCDALTAARLVRFAGETRAKAQADPSNEFQPASTRQLIEAANIVVDGLDLDRAVMYAILTGTSGEGGSGSVRQELRDLWNGVRVWTPEHLKEKGGATGAAPTGDASAQWVCPTHGQAKDIPAGVSVRTGKPYSAFRGCPVFGCPHTSDKSPKSAAVAGQTVYCPDCGGANGSTATICAHCAAALY